MYLQQNINIMDDMDSTVIAIGTLLWNLLNGTSNIVSYIGGMETSNCTHQSDFIHVSHYAHNLSPDYCTII